MSGKKAITMVAVLAFCFSGCATIFVGKNQTVSFNSKPEAASVKVGPFSGTTPYTTKIPKNKGYLIEYSKEGYQRETMELEKRFDPVYLVNILFWPGLIVDLATGAMFKYDPAIYRAELEPR